MNDKELLELAANATGHKWKWTKCPKYEGMEVPGMHHHDKANGVDYYFGWNPLEDDRDAMRLAVDLQLDIDFTTSYSKSNPGNYTLVNRQGGGNHVSPHNDYADPYAATRRAIVRAAAEIGRKMP